MARFTICLILQILIQVDLCRFKKLWVEMALKFLVNLYKLNVIVEEGHSYANSEKFLKRFEIGVLVYKR